MFAGPTDFAYVPIHTEMRISTSTASQIALCTAKARRRIDPYLVRAEDIAVEIRGGGVVTRQINNFLSADVNDADRMIAVEVITPEALQETLVAGRSNCILSTRKLHEAGLGMPDVSESLVRVVDAYGAAVRASA